MAKLKELETAITTLPDDEYRQFRRWFLERDWEVWDKEIEEDSKAGRLNFLVQEALDTKKEQKLKEL